MASEAPSYVYVKDQNEDVLRCIKVYYALLRRYEGLMALVGDIEALLSTIKALLRHY